MPAAQAKAYPRLYTQVLQAIAELKENNGSNIRTIIDHIQIALNVSVEKPKLRNVALQVRRAIQHGVAEGMLRQTGGRIRLSLGNKKSNGIRTCCGFICGTKKKGGKSVAHKSGQRKRGGKHGGGKSRRRRSGSRGAGGDRLATKRKSRRHGGKRRKSVRGGGGGRHASKRRKRSSSHSAPPKRRKKAHRTKKDPDCSAQQYSDEHNEEENDSSSHDNRDQKDSHVSFADEDEICGEQQQCTHQCSDQVQRRKRSNQPPRRTSRQIRQGTPKNLDRCNTEFIPQHENNELISSNEHVPRSSNRNKEDYGVSYNQNTDYINKNFDNNDVHGISQECDNPDCLCNIKQEPVDSTEENVSNVNRDHCPERFSDRKRSRDRDRDSNRDRERDGNRAGYGSSYFTH